MEEKKKGQKIFYKKKIDEGDFFQYFVS